MNHGLFHSMMIIGDYTTGNPSFIDIVLHSLLRSVDAVKPELYLDFDKTMGKKASRCLRIGVQVWDHFQKLKVQNPQYSFSHKGNSLRYLSLNSVKTFGLK